MTARDRLLTEYEVYDPTLPGPQALLTKAQAIKNLGNFLGQIPNRLSHLISILEREGISLDLEEGRLSFARIGQWLSTVAGQESKPEQEKREERELIGDLPGVVEDWRLDRITSSLCYDSGIFFGEALRKSDSILHWEVVFDRRAFDHNWPVIRSHTRKLWLNPVRIMAVQCSIMLEHDPPDMAAEFERLYQVWSNKLKL